MGKAAQKILLFDLDGTLVDSLPDLSAALGQVMVESGLPPASAAESRRYVGDGARVMLERGFAAQGRSLPPEALPRFLEFYEGILTRETRPFPGVESTLAALAAEGWEMAVCTNKTERFSRIILERLGLARHFAAIAGGDSWPERKPDGRHLTRTLATIGGDPAAAVMVGDGLNDVLAARDARLPVVVVGWGYGDPAQLGGDRTIAAMAELAEVAAGLLAERMR